MEKYRDLGCEIQYLQPNWVKEEFKKLGKLDNYNKFMTIEDILGKKKNYIKQTFPKKYTFNI